MTMHQDDALDETDNRSATARMINAALRALHMDPDGGGAIGSPAVAAGRLVAAAEILARALLSVPDDPDGARNMDDLMHGFYETVVAFSNGMPEGTSSALRGALLEDRLRRADRQADLAGEETEQLRTALNFAVREARRLRTKGGIL
ncbi:hypothetical protein [Streptomyces sp. AM6-12]|uniref:hypothetical protein n=1 Tax=Streptomyces sp. AM6-12 TaxID=3345149 RepID=UPI0037AEC909